MEPKKHQKTFCESINGGYTKEFFVVVMQSGEIENAYALTPEHMKRASKWFAHQVGEFEKKFGVINAKWEPGIQSPLQINDLKGGKK